MRPEGKAPPQRLTTTQRQIMQRLVDAHGDDIEVACLPSFSSCYTDVADSSKACLTTGMPDNAQAMSRDRKLNSMLHSKAKLSRMLESLDRYGSSGRTAFRAPKKRLW